MTSAGRSPRSAPGMATIGGPGGASRSTSDAFAPIAASVLEPGSRTMEAALPGVGASAPTSAPRMIAFTSFVIDLLRRAPPACRDTAPPAPPPRILPHRREARQGKTPRGRRIAPRRGLWQSTRSGRSMAGPSPSAHPGEHYQLGDEYYVLASSLASRRRKHVLAHADAFAVLDQSGDIPAAVEEELGLFYRGT